MESIKENCMTALIAAACLLILPVAADAHYTVRHSARATVGVQHASTSHTHKVAPRHHRAHTKRQGVVSYYGSHRSYTHAGLLAPPHLPAAISGAGAGNYIAQTEGVSRWADGHTIHVYVAPGRTTFPSMVAHCFDQWSKATGGKIHYMLVPSRAQADYTIGWTSHQKEVDEGTEAGLTTTDTYVDGDGREYIDRARTNILTRFDGHALSDKDIAETCLHEIGHGLGIEGHSSNPADIMYYAVSSRQTGHLTPRDCNTMAQIYSY